MNHRRKHDGATYQPVRFRKRHLITHFNIFTVVQSKSFMFGCRQKLKAVLLILKKFLCCIRATNCGMFSKVTGM